MDFTPFEVLTFDCYGTLVDWETGILNAFHPILAHHRIVLEDVVILERYGRLEAQAEAGTYQIYRDVLRSVAREFCLQAGFVPDEAETESLVRSFANWKPFPDTVSALQALKQRFRLVILSNVDDDLFAHTAPQLEVAFDDVITAQQVQSYKPSLRNFEVALDRIGLPREKVLHVAQSLFHDIVPTNTLGIANVWVNRHHGRAGHGATVPVNALPTLEVPDMRSLAALATGTSENGIKAG